MRPGQISTAEVEQIVDIPARGGLQGFLPGQGSLHRVDCLTGEELRRYSASRVRECPPVPAHPSWALIKCLWARESDESGEDGTGDSLSAAYAALRRLRRRDGSGGDG